MSNRRRIALAGALALAATVSLSATSPAGAEPAVPAEITPAGDDMSWAPCTEELQAGPAGVVECAVLAVPLDYDDPESRSITVAVSRLRATAPAAQRLGPLMVNFGGPGGTGLEAPAFFAQLLPADLLARYDIIGFDPRGVGASEPLLACTTDAFAGGFPSYEPTTGPDEPPGPNEELYVREYEELASDCAEASGADLQFLRSVNVVRDMESIRSALDAPTLNFVGFSYGTYLGQLYSTQYPTRTGRFVLDANVDSAVTGYQNLRDRAIGADAARREFFAWIADNNDTYGIADDPAGVEQAYLEIERELAAAPGELVGPTEFVDVIFFATYAQFLWPMSAEVFAAAARGDFGPLEALFAPDPTAPADNGGALALFFGVECTDYPWPDDYATFRADATSTATVAPLSAWGYYLNFLPCRTWPFPGQLASVDGSVAPPILLASTALDPTTPLINSLNVRLAFPRAALIVDTDTTGHTASFGGNDCVDARVFEFLRSGTLPPRIAGVSVDLSCSGLPLPVPEEAPDALAATMLRELLGSDGRSSLGDWMDRAAELPQSDRRALMTQALRLRVITGARPAR
ncbi:MAG: alpha/beta fold hydrolase [Sporichthyaceae bacterium]